MRNILGLSLIIITLIAGAQNDVINTSSGTDPLYISRNTGIGETFRFSVGDRSGLIEYLQDETDGDHDFIFNILSGTTGNIQYKWLINNYNTFTINNSDKAFYFNAYDPNHAGLRLLFDQNTNNNGADVDLTINTNSGSPNVDWYIRNWGGSYTFNRGQNDGNGGTIRKELFRIESSGKIVSSNGAEINGNVGIGTPSPSSKLHVNAGNNSIHAMFTGSYSGPQGIQIRRDGGADIKVLANYTSFGGGIESSSALRFAVNGNTIVDPSMYIESTGNIGIGTTSPTHKLEVNGTIRSKEVKVEASPWPDYVFEPDYDLLSLEEIEAFIQSNKHLPEIPTAAEMEANGVLLGEMNRLLLKKIEELTLHLIEQQKVNKELIQRIEKLESK